MGATLYELVPHAPEPRIHMHFGAEDVLRPERAPVLRSPDGTGGVRSGRLRLLPRGACRAAHVQQSRRGAGPDPRNQCRGDSRTSSPTPSTATPGWQRAIPIPSCSREEAPRHHRSLRDPGRVGANSSIVVRPRGGRESGLFGSHQISSSRPSFSSTPPRRTRARQPPEGATSTTRHVRSRGGTASRRR